MEMDKRKKLIYRVTLMGSLVNILLVFLKLAAGFWGRSGAMIADGIHSLSDFVTDLVVLIFVRISSKPSDQDHAYGHGKYETMATAILGGFILAVGIGIFYDAAHKIQLFLQGVLITQPTHWALYASVFSIVCKEILFHYTLRVGKKVKSSLVTANAWHHRSDAFSSIGTLIGISGAILLGKQWAILDPLAAAFVSFFVLRVGLQLIAPSMNDLLEKSLPEEIKQEIITLIKGVDEVNDPHNLRTRRIGNDFAIEVHIRVRGDMSVEASHRVACEIEQKLRQHYGRNTHVAIHIEPIKITNDKLCKNHFDRS